MNRGWLLFLCSSIALSSRAQSGDADPQSWHHLVGILQYLEADYPAAVASKTPSELEEQAAFAGEAVAAAQQLGDRGATLVPRLVSIRDRVTKGLDPEGVTRDCVSLVEDAVQAGGISRSPHRTPSLAQGAELYAVNCAACHGADGRAKTEIAERLDPKPTDFTDASRMDELSAYKAFNVLSFGVSGTPMPSFALLDERDRWDLSFYLLTLRQAACDHPPPRESLEALATSTDPALAKVHGATEVACLRRRLPDADEERALITARAGIEDALRLAALGQSSAAYQAVVDAYLMGIEPIEPLLRARDPALVQTLEAGFARTRLAVQHGSPHVQEEGRTLLTLIDRARRSRPAAQDFVSVFWLTLLILVREGFEASIVIAALLAVLKKMGHTEHARLVHVGWISAAIVGAVAFIFARHLITGANRELMEGIFALLAVGMLVYAALWLNARANIRKFMGHLRERMQGALGRGSGAGLFTIAFTAMLRESLETAVFLQGLSIDSPSGVAWGIGGGLLVLFALVLLINRVGYVLPMKTLFNASTVLLLATAVMLLGKGIHALQEVGWLPLQPISFVRLDALGIYPDGFSLAPQLMLALLPLLWVAFRRQHPDAGAAPRAESAVKPGVQGANLK